MMAYDSPSTPQRRPISPETLAGLRGAVLHLWHAPAAADATLVHALDGLVREAHDKSLRAEDVLLAVKDLLVDLPELNAPDRRLEAVRFREQLVTRCIKAYYGA
jgi:hypothetical protein